MPHVGRYELGSKIGADHFTDVFRGTDGRLARPVLIRKLKPEILRPSRLEDDLWAEARRTRPSAQLEAALLDVVESDGELALVYALPDGSSLEEMLRMGRKPTVEEAAQIVRGLARWMVASLDTRVPPLSCVFASPRTGVVVLPFELASAERENSLGGLWRKLIGNIDRANGTERSLIESLEQGRLSPADLVKKFDAPPHGRARFFGIALSAAALVGAVVLGALTLSPRSPSISISPEEGRASVRVVVRPWAEVFVDGRYVDTTPFAHPISLSVGTHELSFRHPQAKPESRSVTVKAGQLLALDVELDLPSEGEPSGSAKGR